MTVVRSQRVDAPVSGVPEEQPGGLSSEQAQRRLAEVGANAITEAKGPSHVREFGANLVHLFALLLWAGALLALAGGLPELSVAIVIVIIVNAAFAFVQDEWHVTPTFTLNAGLRYDVERIRNIDNFYAKPDRNNIQPRVSATWTPFSSRWSLHSGVGVYTQQHLLYYLNRAQLEGADGASLVTLTPASTLMPVYPNVVTSAVLSQVPRDHYVVADDFRNPYSVQAAAGVVADSIPEMEWQETEHKARALLRAAELVEEGLQ